MRDEGGRGQDMGADAVFYLSTVPPFFIIRFAFLISHFSFLILHFLHPSSFGWWLNAYALRTTMTGGGVL